MDTGSITAITSFHRQTRKKRTAHSRKRSKSIPTTIWRTFIARGLNDDLGNTDEAIGDYTKVCVLLPQYYFAAESLGILEWGKGNYEASCAAFQQALGWAPKNTSYALMTTLCLYRMNKPEEAKKFMTKYITTLDRTTTEYFLCRLFVDKTGDADVLNRISKEKKAQRQRPHAILRGRVL